MKISVAICAYNASTRIGMVLESLAKQSVPEGLAWELLVIDNASTDDTGALSQEMGQKLHLPIRVISEPEPGLSNARRRAAFEAKAEIICFLDDDVVAPPEWVSYCSKWFEDHPRCGILGGKVMPLFEDIRMKPADFDHWYFGVLSMQNLGDEDRQLNVVKGPMIVGAGMAGRRELFRAAFGELRSIAGGRKGSSLAGGEDLEVQLIANRLGWQVWYSPALVLQHWVPNRKLNWGYLEKWFVDTAKCYAWLQFLGSHRNAPSRWQLISAWVLGVKAQLFLAAAALLKSSGNSSHSRFLWVKQQSSRQSGLLNLITNHDAVVQYYSVLKKLEEESKLNKS